MGHGNGWRMSRTLDLIVALVALIVLAPFICIIAATIAVSDGRPVFFRQKRVGQGGVTFTLVKFRSLDETGRKTNVGTFLRRFSLDELPEFWNVLIGDMAIVGPRPMIASEQPQKPLVRTLREKQRPGITGWAQVSGRNAVSFERTYQYDLWYVRNRSLALDVFIILATLPCVLRGHGACAIVSERRVVAKRRETAFRPVVAS